MKGYSVESPRADHRVEGAVAQEDLRRGLRVEHVRVDPDLKHGVRKVALVPQECRPGFFIEKS